MQQSNRNVYVVVAIVIGLMLFAAAWPLISHAAPLHHGPDLVVTEVEVVNGSASTGGTFRLVVKNVGDESTGVDFQVGAFQEPDVPGTSPFAQAWSADLAPGAVYTTSDLFPVSLGGFCVVADFSHLVAEVNESNNTKCVDLRPEPTATPTATSTPEPTATPTTTPSGKPNLVVKVVQIVDGNNETGGAFRFVVENVGNAATGEDFEIIAFEPVLGGCTMSVESPMCDSTPFAHAWSPRLNPGESYESSDRYPAGMTIFWVVADSGDVVTESNEDDNTGIGEVPIVRHVYLPQINR